MDTKPGDLQHDLRELASAKLRAASAAIAEVGGMGTEAQGQLIRPILALAGVERTSDLPEGFGEAVLAVQLAHEASLIHDDIIDSAAERRGVPSSVAREGVAKALLEGDRLLTSAYRAASLTRSLPFVTLFARSVDRTVAWEATQGRTIGESIGRELYEEIARGKAGELLGCALATRAVLEGDEAVDEIFELGRDIGLLYQMLDDLLDYCTLSDTGKGSLGDYSQRRWTWVLEEAPAIRFGIPAEEVLSTLHRPAAGGSAMRGALARFEEYALSVSDSLADRLPAEEVPRAMIAGWAARARQAVERESTLHAGQSVESVLRERVPSLAGADGYLALHSRSFRFASRFFATADAERVARVYAYCRITDDLVDYPPDGQRPEDLITTWVGLSRSAYGGRSTGIPLLDRVMGEMSELDIPFEYASSLADGMRMDLGGERYATMAELRHYTYRVASVVGLWLTRLFGISDPLLLERAERMGHAMQLTNILRDVGEDWRRNRLYLPSELLSAHGVSEEGLARMCAGAPLQTGYCELVEEMLQLAEEDYRVAFAALADLPPGFARPVAVAAHVYRGIHREIRRRGYDNLRGRAHTAPVAKGLLAVRALWDLKRASEKNASTVPVPAGFPQGISE
ncbi:MAG TPA: squalene/phytoene synthase family protein [Longimicrobiaceae bacterium]|nr:squalene/phytoene synthase family protein [Longimicrobiaceae bacterium]